MPPRNTKDRYIAGYTFLEMIFALAIIAMLLAVISKTVCNRQPMSLKYEKAQTEIREFQQAVLFYYWELEKIPTTEEVYATYWKNRKDMGFIVTPLTETLGQVLCNLSSPARTTQESEQRQCQVHGKWVILSKHDFMPLAQFIYVIDDERPVTVKTNVATLDHQKIITLAQLF